MKRKLAGLYAITPDEPRTDILVRKVGQALRGGASVVQYRNNPPGPNWDGVTTFDEK